MGSLFYTISPADDLRKSSARDVLLFAFQANLAKWLFGISPAAPFSPSLFVRPCAAQICAQPQKFIFV
jgi:hypothetical protein